MCTWLVTRVGSIFLSFFSQLLDSRMIVSNRSQRHTCSLMDGQRERETGKKKMQRVDERDGGFTGGRFRVEMIGVRSVSKRDRNEDRDACSTHFSIEASPRASCPLGWPNKTNAFLMDRGQTRAAPLALVLLGRVHAWLRSRTSHSSSHRRLGNENISGADGNESEEVIDVTR